jgi:hypothetical protein
MSLSSNGAVSHRDALLYVFYGSPSTCANRLRIYRDLNPSLRLFGICTDAENKARYRKTQEVLDDLWFLEGREPKWCWHNLDKVVCKWFLERGTKLDFSRILVVDWDVLLLEPVDKWLAQTGPGEVKFIEVAENSRPEENHWTSLEEFEDYKRLCEKSNFQRLGLFNGILFAYTCHKEAFQRFASAVWESPGYCEYRLPSIIYNTGLDISNLNKPPNWYQFANVNGISIAKSVIQQENGLAGGFQLFHPVYEPYRNANLELSLIEFLREGSLVKTISRKFKNLVRKLRGG